MMKKTIRSVIKVFVFVVIVLVSSTFSDIVNADSFFRGTVTLPYEVRWGQAVLQPGDYLILVRSLNQPAQIYSKDGNQMFFTSAMFTELNTKGKTRLIITPNGDKHVVDSLNMPFSGISLIYQPLTKTQRENIAKAGHLQEQVAITARK